MLEAAAQRGCGCPVRPWRCSRRGWMGPWAAWFCIGYDADGIHASVLQPPVEFCLSWAPHAHISVGRVCPSCGVGLWSSETDTWETPFLRLWVAAIQSGCWKTPQAGCTHHEVVALPCALVFPARAWSSLPSCGEVSLSRMPVGAWMVCLEAPQTQPLRKILNLFGEVLMASR